MKLRTLMIKLVFLAMVASPVFAGTIERVSIDSNGGEANGASRTDSSISADGRYVAFTSAASNLVAGDTNGVDDVFLHDRVTGSTVRVSVDSNGAQANAGSYAPSLSADGRYVAFISYASNLVQGDTNGFRDIFVYDRVTGNTERVSLSETGAQATDTSLWPSISPDGNLVLFKSYDDTLVGGNPTLEATLFVRDRANATTSIAGYYEPGASGVFTQGQLNGDGTKLVFHTVHTKLFGQRFWWYVVYTHDLATGQSAILSSGYQPSMSADGRYVAYYSLTSRIKRVIPGFDIGASVSGIFLHDTVTNEITFLHYDANGNPVSTYALSPEISADGLYVAYEGGQIYLYDRQAATTETISVNANGTPGDDSSFSPVMSSDARYIAFTSNATNLVPGDTNGVSDIFVYDRGPSLPETPGDLITLINDLLAAGEVDNHGIANSLIATLQNAQAAIDRGDVATGLSMLETFIKKVQAQAGKHISDDAADLLIQAAQNIIDSI